MSNPLHTLYKIGSLCAYHALMTHCFVRLVFLWLTVCGVFAAEPKGIDIYLLSDSALTWEQVKNKPLADLTVAEAPWLSSESIEMYDASSHCFYLKGTKPKTPPVHLRGLPFVVMAGQERC